MEKKILFSPVGNTDPIKYFSDGSMIHIARVYQPDVIYLYLSKEILKYWIGGIYPTLVTYIFENIKKATAVIKEASQKQTSDMAKILGIHLEGIFINPEKKGIHNPKHFLAPTIENYK